MIFVIEIASLFYQLMAIIVGSVTFLVYIKDLKDLPKQKHIEAVFLGVFLGLCSAFLSAIIWPFTIFSFFQDSNWRFKDVCCTKHQIVTLLIILVCSGYLFNENEVLQKTFFPKKYWTKEIEELNSAIQFNQRMIRGLSAYNFHIDQQEHDLIMHRHYLKENYKKLKVAKKKLQEYSRKR